MSVARVYTQKSRKARVCEKDRTVIKPGDTYRSFWVGFRSRYAHIRCMNSTCTPRTSELESSKLSAAYAAIEAAEDSLAALEAGDPEDDASSIDSAVNEAADEIRTVADEYREADQYFGGGGMTDSSERADELENTAYELESFSSSESEPDFDGCGDDVHDEPEKDEDREVVERGNTEECSSCETIKLDWWAEQISEARDALSNASF